MALNAPPKHNWSKDIPRPFSLRFTTAQRRALEARAGSLPLGEYIRGRLFSEDPRREPARRHPRPVRDHKALAEVLAQLGASRLSSNLNQLARAANAGALPVTPETEEALQQACRDIASMKATLLTALGLKETADR